MPNQLGAPVTGRESEIELVERLFRSLSHLIRGDLAVIQNELACLASAQGCADLHGAARRCGSISAKLSTLSAACAPRICEEVFLDDILAAFGHSAPQSLGRLVGDPSAVRLILSFLPRALEKRPQSISCERSDATFRLKLSFARSEVSSHAPAAFPSLSGFASAELGEAAVIEASIADLVMRACGWRASIGAGERAIEASFVGPVVSCELAGQAA